MIRWGLITIVYSVIALSGVELIAEESIDQQIMSRHLRLIDTTPVNQPVILRLDLELLELVRQAKSKPIGSQAAWVAAGMSPQAQLYRRFGMSDLSGFAKLLLGQAEYPHVSLHLDAYQGRNLSEEIQAAYRSCVENNGGALPKAPIYKVAFGYQKQTNAAMEGRDRRTGRHIVILNLSALAEGDNWEAAILHETWHTFQGRIGKTLGERSVHEGMATYLTGVTDPDLQDHQLMMWTRSQWDAASQHHDAILQAFADSVDSQDASAVNAFTKLNVPLSSVPDAPDRCGYYVGLLACRAWRQEHPDRTIADLIATSAQDILQSLPLEKSP
ncbi:MAG: hypothetical protein HKN47_04415 [Pirellulaceae bacterium]|nr:hypothetical protein [Pirellulaceae bacterium]